MREDTVEKQLDELKGCGVGAYISWVADAIATDGDAGTIRIIFICHTSHTTMVWHISFHLWDGMS